MWYSVFGPPDVLVTDGGAEFAGSVQVTNDLFAVVHEVVPEGAQWRLGQAERHGAIVKLMLMKMVLRAWALLAWLRCVGLRPLPLRSRTGP